MIDVFAILCGRLEWVELKPNPASDSYPILLIHRKTKLTKTHSHDELLEHFHPTSLPSDFAHVAEKALMQQQQGGNGDENGNGNGDGVTTTE